MALANIPPHMAAEMNRARAEREAMCSPDPVARYKAREQAINRAMTEFSSVLVQNAQNNARAAEQQELEAQRFEREYYKNR